MAVVPFPGAALDTRTVIFATQICAARAETVGLRVKIRIHGIDARGAGRPVQI